MKRLFAVLAAVALFAIPSLAQAPLPLNQAYTCWAVLRSPSTGDLTAADATPTYEVLENGTEAAIISGNLVARGASSYPGEYYLSFTVSAANNFDVGSIYTARVAATVETKPDKADCPPFHVVAAEVATGVPAMLLSNGTGTGQVLLNAGHVGIDLDAMSGTLGNAEIATGALSANKLNADVVPALQSGAITIKKNTALANFPIWMLDANNAGVPSIAASITCRVQLDAGAWALLTDNGSISEPGGTGNGRGEYLIDLLAGETNGNNFSLECQGPGAAIFRYSVTTQH